MVKFSPETWTRIPAKTLSSPSSLPSRVEPRKKPAIYLDWYLHRDRCHRHGPPRHHRCHQIIVSIILFSFHYLFLASEDLPNGPALVVFQLNPPIFYPLILYPLIRIKIKSNLVVFQRQDLTLCRCPRVVLATVPPGNEDC